MNIKKHQLVKDFFKAIKPAKLANPSVYAFALPKSGSKMFFSILNVICSNMHLSYIDLPLFAYTRGIQYDKSSIEPELKNIYKNDKGCCFCGFRHFPKFIKLFGIENRKLVLIVRDPRDILVSYYFSMKYSHPKFVASTDNPDDIQAMNDRNTVSRLTEKPLDDYVLILSHGIKLAFDSYSHLIDNTNIKIFQYENFIFNKYQWINDVVKHFGWDVPEIILREVIAKYDIFPVKEDQSQHIRKVTPGDYKEKLSLKTIQTLDEQFKDVYDAYGYKAHTP